VTTSPAMMTDRTRFSDSVSQRIVAAWRRPSRQPNLISGVPSSLACFFAHADAPIFFCRPLVRFRPSRRD